MTSVSGPEIIQRFPLFDETLANFIHEQGECKIFHVGDVLMKPGQFFKYAIALFTKLSL